MLRLPDWRVVALALVTSGALPMPAQAPEALDGAWVARNVRWQAPRRLIPSEQTDPRRRSSETVLVDLQLEIRQVDDSLVGRLSSVRDPEDVRWIRLLAGRRVGDSVYLAAPAGPGQPTVAFEGTVSGTELTGRLNMPPPADLRPGLLRAPAGAAHRQAIPALPVRDQWLPVQFWRAPD